jgi:hypothetical protein
VKQTKETCVGYNVATINVALRHSSGASNFTLATLVSDVYEGGGPCKQETNTDGDDDWVMVFPDHDDVCAVISVESGEHLLE